MEMTFAIILLMTLVLGVTQVAFVLYARNIVISSAHEGARAAIERGRTESEAEAIARDVVARAAGALVQDLEVDVATVATSEGRRVMVRVRGLVRELGPIPIPIPLLSTATAHLDEAGR